MAQCAAVVFSQRSVSTIWLGRQRELADLEAGLAELETGRGGLYLVAGEPGIGKTRLCDQLARAAAARGIAVNWGRAWEAGGAPSYWPFTQILRGVCRGLDTASLAELMGAQAHELSTLLPELRARLAVRPPEESAHERFELFDAVSTFLHAVATRAPQLLIVDDLHAADPSSIRMLHFLVRDLRTRPLMIVGTYREAEARLLLEIGRTLARVAREAVVLPLRRFDRREVAEFVSCATGIPADDARVDAFFQRTEGNPLFLRELLQLQGSTVHAPDGIREVVRARLALLGPELRATLETAAILGREFTLDMLAAIAGLPDGDVSAHLAPAVDAGIVEPLDSARWRFTHVLLREGLYDDLAGERRGVLHRRAADELRDRDGDPSERAHHLLRALPAVPLADAVDAALRAAEHAMAILAFEDAEAVVARVVKPLEAANDPRRLCEALLALGVARIRALDLVAGRNACLRAAEIARTLGDGELFARAVLGAACDFNPGFRDLPLIALLEEALTLLPQGDGALRARCMSQLAAERHPEPDTSGPIDLARSAVAMARRIGDRDALLHTISTVGLAMLAVADPHERLAQDQEGLRLALAANHRLAAMRLHLFMTLDLGQLGDIASSEAQIRAFVALHRDRRNRRTRSNELSFLALAALWRGHFDEAKGHYDEFEAIAREDPLARDGFGMLAFGAGFRRAVEDYSDLPAYEIELRNNLAPIYGELGGCLAELLICQLHASSGDRERTAAQLALVRAHPVFAQLREPSWLAILVDAIHLLGDTELASAIYPLLLPRATWFFTLGPLGSYIEPPFSRQLGLLAHTLGQRETAAAHLADAEQRMVRAGMVAHLARVRRELAAVNGAGGDLRASTAEPTGIAFSLVREGEYWTISAGGKTLRLRDSRGLRVLDELVAKPGVELHVLELVSSDDEERDGGDAGVVLDAAAVQCYRARLLDLREELEEAEERNDAGRAERARHEIEMLTQELARAVGLGGRARRTGGAAERARTTVQKRLRDAIRRIEEGLPELGRHLDQTVRTGLFCGYFPQGRSRARRP